MFQELIKRLEALEKIELQIYAKGNYPKGTVVQHVAHWQNDGTDRVTPARFVETAEMMYSNKWNTRMIRAADMFLKSGSKLWMIPLGRDVARDIGNICNRIDTGRLKRSFTFRLIDDES